MAVPAEATKRLLNEVKLFRESKPEFIQARPLEHNILECIRRYVIEGPPDCPYTGGEYYGKVVFPKEYPFKPPSIIMITPNGRFQPNSRICLSISDYHPESWNPGWNLSAILVGLLSFMLEDGIAAGTVTTSVAEKKLFALKSKEFNRKDPIFNTLFYDLVCPPVSNSVISLLDTDEKEADIKVVHVIEDEEEKSHKRRKRGKPNTSENEVIVLD